MPTNSGIGFDLKYLDEQMPIYESGISLERMKYLVAIDELRKRGWVSSVVGVTSGTSPYGNHNTFYFLDTSRFSEIEKLVGGDE